jgi:flagellar biosynthetic protein FliQ
MSPEDVARLAREALWLVLLLSAPALLASLVSGLVVSVFQAVTQLQDSTLSFVPKMATVFLALAISGPWIGAELARFTRMLWQAFP